MPYDETVGLVINIIFTVIGAIGYVCLPRISVPVLRGYGNLSCVTNDQKGQWAAWVDTLTFLNLTYFGYYLVFIILYDVDQHIWDLGRFTEDYRIFISSLTLGMVIAILLILIPRWIWPVIIIFVFFDALSISVVSCDANTCYTLRTTVMLAAVVIAFGALSCCCVNIITNLIAQVQNSFASSFTVVFGMAQSIWGYSYWIDDKQPAILLAIVAVLTILRAVYVKIVNTCLCCGRWKDYFDSDLDEEIAAQNIDAAYLWTDEDPKVSYI